MITKGIKAKCIYQGSKLMYAALQNQTNIRLVDSLNFLPMALSKLPAAFELSDIRKGMFPHNFNTWENQDYIGVYPDPHYYGSEYMLSEDFTAFNKWHTQQVSEDKVFDFAKEILAYCVDDVNILRRACLKYRKHIMNLTGSIANVKSKDDAVDCSDDEDEATLDDAQSTAIDPFTEVTGASLCMRIYRTKFYHTDPTTTPPIAQIPYQGYARFRQCSVVSVEWLEYLMHTEKHFIRHALNYPTGEFVLGNFKADGFCETTNTVLLFHGCVFHGCRTCTKGEKHPMTKQPSIEVYKKTVQQEMEIKAMGFKLRVIWEHEWTAMKKNPDIKSYVSGLDIAPRLDPRYVYT
jgi:hypothetical protein